MADYFTQFSCQPDVGAPANATSALAIFQQLAAELDETEGVSPGLEVRAEGDGILWIRDAGDYGDPEHVITFVLRCAQAFDLQGRWGFAWALTCSRPLIDGFGGGAQMIDLGARTSIGWTDCQEWVIARLDDVVTSCAETAGIQTDTRGRAAGVGAATTAPLLPP